MSFVAGQYTAVWNSLNVGQIAAGIKIHTQVFKRLITGDNHADTPQCAVYRGKAMWCDYIMEEYNAAAVKTLINPYDSDWLKVGRVGVLDATTPAVAGGPKAKPLVMTAVLGTAAQGTPATLTFPSSILHEGYPIELLFAPDLRTVPMQQRFYPNTSGVFGSET